jgi:carbohydrate kinase (thermoresistant glucokinase family)
VTHSAPQLVVVMGVSGSGKSTVGGLLAQLLGAEFLEGDDLHPPRNVEQMATGVPLTDDDRRDWLLALAQRLSIARDAQRSLVVSCSALKHRYRDVLRGASADLAFVHLHADAALLEARMHAREDHFMPASLLASQLHTLEAPGTDEHALTLAAALPAAVLAAKAAAWLELPATCPTATP